MKNLSAGLKTNMESGVIRLAQIVTIHRRDGIRHYLTNHDQPLVVDGQTYRNDISFQISAITTSSDLSADTCSIEAALDGAVFVKDDFRKRLWKNALIEIAEVDWANPALGRVVLRRGLARTAELNKNNTVRFDVDGVLKVLDFGLGRKYTPVCVAELGDKKCRVAIRFGQHRSFLNPYYLGDWAYWYDENYLTPLTLTNGDFSTDGDRSSAQAITGWTKSGTWIVDDVHTNVVTHRDSNRALAGGTDSEPNPREQHVYQDIDVTSLASDIDDGKIAVAVFAEVAQTTLNDYFRLRVDALDTDGAVIQSESDGWQRLDAEDAWRERATIFYVIPETKTLRVYLEARRKGGTAASINWTNVRALYWDHTDADPTHGSIFKAISAADNTTADAAAFQWLYPINPGFEVNGPLAASDHGTQDITGWVKDSGTFKVAASNGSALSNGSYGLFHGDDVDTSYIYTDIDLSNYVVIDTAAIDAGEASILAVYNIMRPNTTNTWGFGFAFYDASNVLISNPTKRNSVNKGGTTPSEFTDSNTIPPGTRKIRLRWQFVNFLGTANSGVGLDNVKFVIQYTGARPNTGIVDADVRAFGDEEAVPDYTLDESTTDGDLIWRAYTSHVDTDVVATVTDAKTFTATNMAGAAGTYETTKIRWLSGANAGRENVIRVWTHGSKTVKLFYPEDNAIAVGDRFAYVQGCQKRFAEDCVAKFDNALNFRGFPYVPGNING